MRQVEAKFLITHEWEEWRAKNLESGQPSSGTDGLAFFMFLQQERAHLLKFKYHGDKWQIVHGWLLQEGLVGD